MVGIGKQWLWYGFNFERNEHSLYLKYILMMKKDEKDIYFKFINLKNIKWLN